MLLGTRSVMAAALVAWATGATAAASLPAMKTTKATSAADFLDTIGICGTAKAATATMLSYLGIRHLRTGTSAPSLLLAAGTGGAKMDIIVPWHQRPITSQDLKALLAEIGPAASVIEAVEGPNEVNHMPDSFEGMTGVAGVLAEQKQLYALVKADKTLNNVTKSTPVYSFTVLQGTPASIYGDLSAHADVVNMHAYGGPGIPPAWVLPFETARYRIAGKPLVMTETGATTIASKSGVSEEVQARHNIKALLDAYKLNVSRTYIFNLQDWSPTSNTADFSAHYGLYNLDGTVKLAGKAMHDFTDILSRNAHGTQALQDELSYSLSGLPYYGKSELLFKAGGVFDLVVWNETKDWDAATRSEVEVPNGTITLTLATVFETIAIYNPIVSSNPIATVSNARSIKFDLTHDPLIVELNPVGAAAYNALSLAHGSHQ